MESSDWAMHGQPVADTFQLVAYPRLYMPDSRNGHNRQVPRPVRDEKKRLPPTPCCRTVNLDASMPASVRHWPYAVCNVRLPPSAVKQPHCRLADSIVWRMPTDTGCSSDNGTQEIPKSSLIFRDIHLLRTGHTDIAAGHLPDGRHRQHHSSCPANNREIESGICQKTERRNVPAHP